MILEKVKKIADKQGISIAALEKAANIGNGTIRRWSTSSPNLDSLKAVAKVLHVEVNELIE